MKKVITPYLDDVKAYLNEHGIHNKQGEPYSDTYIIYVFNGYRENLDIENAILAVYHRKLQRQNLLKEKKRNILKK